MPENQNKKEKFIQFTARYALLIIALFSILTYFMAPRAIKLIKKVSTRLEDLLPNDYSTVRVGEEVQKKFKEEGRPNLIILFESNKPQENRKLLFDFKAYFETFPEVGKIKYIKNHHQDFFSKHKLLYLEQDDLIEIRDRIKRKIQREKLSGLYIDFESDENDDFSFDDFSKNYDAVSSDNIYFSNDSETIYAIYLYPSSEDRSLSFYKEFHDWVEAKVADFDFSNYKSQFELYYAGSINTKINEYSTLMNDLKMAGLISFCGIFLLILVYFKKLTSVLFLFIPLSMGILISFGLSSYFISSLNIVTSFLFSILLGLGIDIGIHLLARYEEDRIAGLTQLKALEHIFYKTGRSATIAALTTCGTFFILILNDFRGFSEFGWIAGIGLLTILVTYLFFFPALLVCAEKIRLIRFKQQKEILKNLILKCGISFPHTSKVLIFSLIFLLGSGVLSTQLDFEWNFSVLKINPPNVKYAREKLAELQGGNNRPAVIEIDGKEDALKLKSYFKERKQDPESIIARYQSSYDVYPEDQKQRMSLLQEIDTLLSDDALNILKKDQKEALNDFRSQIAKTELIKKEDIPESFETAFFGKGDYKEDQLSLIYPKGDAALDDGRNAIRFFNEAHHIQIDDKDYYAVSSSMVFADVLLTLFRDSKRTILLSLLALFIIIFLDFRSLKDTLVIYFSLLMGLLGMCGLIVAFGWKFNFYNIISIPVVLGMGVDNAVHLVHRFIEGGRKNIIEALSSSGVAAGIASLTTICGYSGLAFAHHPGLQSIGLFTIIGMLSCMFASLIFLPCLIQKFFISSPKVQ